jgi:hypothetical protein
MKIKILFLYMLIVLIILMILFQTAFQRTAGIGLFLSQFLLIRLKFRYCWVAIFDERAKKIRHKWSRIRDIFTLREIFSQTFICGNIL